MPLDIVICEAIAPLVRELKSKSILGNFFFIRYWEGGPHIRFRIKCKNEHVGHLTNYIPLCLHQYFNSRRLAGMPEEKILVIDYNPELERYGGSEAMPISEDQFQLSSEMIISILCDQQFSHRLRIMFAVYAHILFAHACAVTLEDIVALYKKVSGDWSQQLVRKSGNTISTELLEEQYNKAFALLEKKLRSVFSPVMNHLGLDLHFQDQWMMDWVTGMRIINDRLIACQRLGKFKIQESMVQYEAINPDLGERMAVYESYIHMTNNRLGIVNKDEGYVAYVIYRLASTHPQA